MIRYFYRVEFSYYENEHSNGHLDLGIFSTKKKAEEKIRRSVNLTGFNKYGIDNFKIIKFGVNFDVAPEDKSKAIFYILGLIIVLAFLFVISTEVPVKVEHVEQPLENTFLNNK